MSASLFRRAFAEIPPCGEHELSQADIDLAATFGTFRDSAPARAYRVIAVTSAA